MDLRQLRYFATIAEELHFSRAAHRLGIAQPALSHQIRQIEGELGVELLTRTTRVVGLTEAGRVLAEETPALLECTDRIAAAARANADAPDGTLRLGAVPSAIVSLVPELLRAFHARAPRVGIDLHGLGSRDQIEALRAGDLDVGVVHAPLGADDMASQPLREEPMMLALPAEHPLARDDELPLAAVADEPFLMFPRAHAPVLHDEMLRHCRNHGFTPRIAYDVTGMGEALALVGAGFAVALVPASFDAHAHPGVILVPVTPPVPTAILLAIWRRGAAPPTLRILLETARELPGMTPAG